VKDILQKSVPVAVLLVVLILLLAFHALPPKHSTGFFVALAPARCPAEDDSDDRLIILRITNGGTQLPHGGSSICLVTRGHGNVRY
jgi:hypothetical protein